ncbi:MAG: hypothetical protein CMJ86_09440 [Planctomycetes bacterium]|jgi:hypothetical protein|nr:hypothetical protein [Planctomycetota bacterium]
MRIAMRNFLIIAAFCSFAACAGNKGSESSDNAAPAAGTTTLFLGNTTCATSGHATKPENFVEHEGQRAYFCCSKCVASANADPAAAVAKAYANPTAVGNTACPISGKDVNADDSMTWQGHTVALCCGRCKKSFASDRAGHTKTAIESK